MAACRPGTRALGEEVLEVRWLTCMIYGHEWVLKAFDDGEVILQTERCRRCGKDKPVVVNYLGGGGKSSTG